MNLGEPEYHAIDMMPVIADIIDGGLIEAQRFHAALLEARDRAHVLDDATVRRAIVYHEEALAFIPIQAKQMRRWAAGQLTSEQSREIARLNGRLADAKTLHTAGLALARELAKGTIGQVMAKSDEQLGREALCRSAGTEGGTNGRADEAAADLERLVKRLDDLVCALGPMSDIDLFTAMGDHMPLFRQILDRLGPHMDLMNRLTRQYPGFAHYSMVLESIAEAMSSGRMPMPGATGPSERRGGRQADETARHAPLWPG